MSSSKNDDTEPSAWRLLNGFMGGLFTLFAYVQQNDPDPELWMAIYLIPAFLCVAIAISSNVTENQIWRIISLLHVVVLGCFSVFLVKTMTDNATDMKYHEMEEGRELGGLLFVMVWLIICSNSTRFSLKYLALGGAVLTSVPILLWIGIYINTEYRKILPEHCKTVMYADKET
ncbi:transmembrane protein 220-like [Ptychodera flava]|uniref:transmembrane protein 220-like n=1 Tax=Ptychodera flava TaxID=63121 RepID=UPI00396A35C5